MINWLFRWFRRRDDPPHLRLGREGERVARQYLEHFGLCFLVANYRYRRGVIDLIFRDGEVLVFVEVKARSSDDWVRPATAVTLKKQQILSRTALGYLAELGRPRVPFRFDIVEVILRRGIAPEVCHIPDAFLLSAPSMYR